MKTAGFSLIEVLIATAVLTLGVASLAQLVVVSARANRIANTTSAALLLAERKMEALIGETDPSPSPSGALIGEHARVRRLSRRERRVARRDVGGAAAGSRFHLSMVNRSAAKQSSQRPRLSGPGLQLATARRGGAPRHREVP